MPITDAGLQAAVKTFEDDWILTPPARETLTALVHVANTELNVFETVNDAQLRGIAGDPRLDGIVNRVRARDAIRGSYRNVPNSQPPTLRGITIVHLLTSVPYLRELAATFPTVVPAALILDKD